MPQRLTGKQIRQLKRQQRQQQMQYQPKEPETEKEILDRIRELEYRRIKLPKINHPQLPIVQANIANEINRLYRKLETLKKAQEQKQNVPSS